MAMVDSDPADLYATAAAQPHDAGLRARSSGRAQAAGIPVEIVSDGFGFFIEPAMVALGVPELPIVTARTTFEGRRASIDYPNGNPRCLVCGTCKRDRVLAHRAAGRRVVFIGDGESDRYAAGYSDVVFAKRSLVRICLEAGWPFQRWTEFREIEDWLRTTARGLARRSRRRCRRCRPARRHRTGSSAASRSGARAWSIRPRSVATGLITLRQSAPATRRRRGRGAAGPDLDLAGAAEPAGPRPLRGMDVPTSWSAPASTTRGDGVERVSGMSRSTT